MKAARIPYHLYVRAFENAKWILTDKKSGEVTEYNFSEMSRIVKDAYISHNSRLAAMYSKKEVKPQTSLRSIPARKGAIDYTNVF